MNPTYVLPDGTTTCCGSYSSYHIDGAIEYCKGCDEYVIDHLTVEPREPITIKIR